MNVTYDEALVTADRHLVFKNGIKEIAAQEGRAATFMAKWTMDDVGSSCHVHTSLWDLESGEPLMAPVPGGDGASHPSGLSTLGRRFLAGQLHAARELAWMAAPTVNSYRRYVPGSWAPTAAVYGEDNRTCGFRLVGHGAGRRVESRIPGADVNPYLVLAAAIAAGLYGIDHELEPGDPYPVNAYEATDVPRIPSTLVEAIAELRDSAVALEAFGPDVHHHLLNTAEQEWLASNRHVTDWELARNFERICTGDLRDGSGGAAAATPIRSPGHAALATVLGRIAALAGPAGLGRAAAADVGGGRRRTATSCSTARCGSGSSSPRRCGSGACWPPGARGSGSAWGRSRWWRSSPPPAVTSSPPTSRTSRPWPSGWTDSAVEWAGGLEDLNEFGLCAADDVRASGWPTAPST